MLTHLYNICRRFSTMNHIISAIPQDLQLKLARLLDRKDEPNWKTFVAQIPNEVYTFKKGEYETLRLAILKPNGSPTIKLIEKLGSKNVQVCHFIDILERLPDDENIHKALDLFLGGMVFYDRFGYQFRQLDTCSMELGSAR